MDDQLNTNIPICILTPQGVQAAPYTANSLAEAATKEPDGIYTVSRTYQRNHALLLDDHLDRLEQSAKLEHIDLHLDRPALRQALRLLIDQSSFADSRFRITVPHTIPDQITISLEPFKPVSPEIMVNGARVITVHMARHNPAAKTTAWMNERKSTVAAFPPGIYEGILVGPDDQLLEGTSSNFYAILNGVLRMADEGILGGIARRAVLKVAPEILPVDLHPVRTSDKLEEAFLTSAGRGIVPIVAIDDEPIGDGKPGLYTGRLQNAYNAWTAAHIEPI